MATFNYTYPAFNGDPLSANYATNLNYMLSTDARAFALNNMVHVDGVNHPSRSGANLYEFYATGSQVCLAGAQTQVDPWTIVSNPAGTPVVAPGQTYYLNATGTGVWLVGINVASSATQTELAAWYGDIGGIRVGYPQAGDVGFYGTRVIVAQAPWFLNVVAYTPVAATITAKAFGLRIAN